ncbi:MULTISPECIES: gamma-mobile-trio protein GmtX [Methylobacter]
MKSPDEVFEMLWTGASSRKQRSLKIIQQICEEQMERNSHDFSISTIGKLSQKSGGPSEQAIRNKNGENYRQLITSWLHKSELTRKKSKAIPKQEDILQLINNPVIRAEVGLMLAEIRNLRGENRLLKSLTKDKIVIDRSVRITANTGNSIELLPAVPLSVTEIKALESAVSDRIFNENGWKKNDDGSVRNEYGRKIYEPGYVLAILKILEQTAK